MEALRIILLGPPGVGKGTQAQILLDRTAGVQLSTGDLLRAAVRDGTELGLEAKKYMDAGELVPDDVILGMVRERMAEWSDATVVFDGFPRTVDQARGLDNLLAGLEQKVDAAVELVVDDEEVVERLSARRTCPECGAVFNLLSAPPAEVDVCDRCGHEGLVQRQDDTPEVIRKRLEVYHEQTAPVADYYREAGLLKQVAGNQSVEDVARSLHNALGLASA
jgi:adenylate kinase